MNKHNLNPSDYLLKEVENKEINKYLSAADLGILLRDFHEMNSIVTSGKLVDYLSCGLPVITTSILYKIPDLIKEQSFGLVLENLDVNKVDMEDVKQVIDFDTSKRKSISKWANNNLSMEFVNDEYLSIFKKYSH